MNRAPRLITIGVSVIFIFIGLLGTFFGLLPETVGVWSYVLATAILMLGVIFKKI